MTTRPQINGSGRILLTLGPIEPTMVRISPHRRPANRSNYLISYINVSGLLPVILALLCIFMTRDTCTFSMSRTSVDLARVGSPINMRRANREDAVIVTVNREGRVFLQSDPVRVQSLGKRIREAVKNGAENRVYIRSDARAKYGWVKEVLDEVHASGVEKVGFLVDQRKADPNVP